LDPHYLEWKAKEHNFSTHFIALAGEINRKMPEFTVQKAMRVLNQQGVAPSRSKILALGVAYKRDLNDWRESPAIDVIKLLQKEGADVVYHDPVVPEFTEHGLSMKSVALTEELVKGVELVIILTDHTTVDYQWVVDHAKAVLDTRNATKAVSRHTEKITLL
jgi:nucleotide sugar dehydrogenase